MEVMNGNLGMRISASRREVEENYESALKAMERLKEKMDKLERLIIKNGSEKDANALNAAILEFNDLTDSQIRKSKEVWQKYEALKHECEAQAEALPQLRKLYDACERTEELATDLTCYSLGHPKAP
jgi:DNA repair ATPase RecN